jgi:hypothetical protein
MSVSKKRIISFIDYDFYNEDYFDYDSLLNIESYTYFTRSNFDTHHRVKYKTDFYLYNFMTIDEMKFINLYYLKVLEYILSDLAVMKAFERFQDSLRIKTRNYELLETIQKAFYFIINIIEKKNINEIWFFDVPHLPLEILTYQIAQKINLKTKYIFWLPRIKKDYEVRGMVCYNIDSMPKKFSELVEQQNINSNEKLDIKKTQQDSIVQEYIIAPETKRILEINYLKRLKFVIRNHGLTFAAYKSIKYLLYIFNLLKNQIRVNRLLKYCERISSSELPYELDYFYFPLHFQPEATTQIRAGVFDDQLNLINLISSLLPDDKYLIVKEHPAYWTRKWNTNINSYRSKKFYSSIMDKQNVILVDYKLDSNALIEKSKGVIAITGTVVLEGLKNEKLTLLFGRTPYSNLPNVKVPYNDENILEFLLSKEAFDSHFNYNSVNNIISNISFLINYENINSKITDARIIEYRKIVHELIEDSNDT